MDIENDKLKDMTKDTVKDEAKSAAEDKALDKKAAVDSGVNKALGEDAGGIVNNATDTALSGGLDGKSADEIKKQVTEQAEAEAIDKAQTAATDEAARASAKLEEKYGKAGGVAGQGIEAVAEGDFSGDSDQIKDSIKSNVEDKAGDAVESEVDSAVSGQTDKIAAQADDKVSGAGDLVNEGADSVSENVSDSIKQSFSADETKDSVGTPKVETPKAKEVVTQRETAEAKPEAPSETGEACEDPQSFNGPLKWAPPPKSLQFAPNVANTWVIDYDSQPWQSVAVVPQMYKWKHEFPAPKEQGPFDPNFTAKPLDPNVAPKPDWGKSNAIDFFNETFLKERLAELEKNELTEVTLGAGFLYVYCNGYLCMEYEVRPDDDPAKLPALHAIDLNTYAGCDERPAGDDSVGVLELPFGGCEDQKYELAYSEYQWPWLLVNFYGGVSEELDFGEDFTKAYVHDSGALPDILKAEEDERILKRSPADAEARRAERFTVVDLAEGTDFIAFKEEIEKPDLFVSTLFPDSLADLYPQLRDEPDFEYPCNWAIHYTVEHANALATQLVESFNHAHTGLMTLTQCMGDPGLEEFFPYVRYFEAAMLTAQLYYATPDTQNQAKGATKWARDHNYAQFTEKLAHEDILSVLMTKERAVYRNILLLHTHLLGTIMAPGHSKSLEWKTTKGKTLKHERLNSQLMAFLDGLRCSPLLKEEGLDHDPCTADSPPRTHAGDRWGHVSALIHPFSIDPDELGLLFAGEPSYHDNYIKNLSSFKEVSAYVQRNIIEGEGAGKRIAKSVLPNSFEALFDFENILAELFALDDQPSPLQPAEQSGENLPDIFNVDKDIALIFSIDDEDGDDSEAEEADPHAEKRQELKEKLYEKWLEVLTVDQNKKANKKSEYAFTDKELKDFIAGATPIFKAIAYFTLKFPKVINNQVGNAPLLADLHFDNVKKLVNANSSLFMEKTLKEKIFTIGELKFNDKLDGTSVSSITTLDNYNSTNKSAEPRGKARKARRKLIYDFLQELDNAAENGRGSTQADSTRKTNRDKIDRDASRHNNRARRYNQVVVTSNQKSYDAALADKSNKRRIVLSPEDSKVWMGNLENNIYLVSTKGANTYKEAMAKHVKGANPHMAAQGLLALVDLYNLYTSLSALQANSDSKKQATLVWGVINGSLGFTGSVAGILDNYGKMGDASKSVGLRAAPISRFSTAILGKRIDGWKLSRYTVGTKYIPVVGGIIGLTMSSMDLSKSYQSGDDVFVVHLISAAGAGMGLIAVVAWGAWLGPAGIALALVGYWLSRYVFKQDDVLEEWLDHGPFARERGGSFMKLEEVDIRWAPSKSRFHKGVDNTLTVEKEKFWGDEKYSVPDKTLRIRFSGQYVVFDKNYTLLGTHANLAATPTHGVKKPLQNKYPSYFKIDGDQLLFKDKPIGELGKPFANSALELRRKMQQYYTEATGYTPKIDRSERFDAGLSSWGDTDEKFTIPFQFIPESNIEALLNATYPLAIELDMYQSKGKFINKNRDTREGNNVCITIDVPYFIEGQSKLIVELREDRGIGDNRYDMQVVPMHFDKATKESEYRIEIDTVVGLEDLKPESKKLVSDKVEYKLYKSDNKGIAQVVIVANIDPRLIHEFEDKWLKTSISLEAWARLSINGARETEKTVTVDGKELKALWMPYRSSQGWEDYEDDYNSINQSVRTFEGKYQEDSDAYGYANDNEDWASASASDVVR